jgi:hypothetical protein
LVAKALLSLLLRFVCSDVDIREKVSFIHDATHAEGTYLYKEKMCRDSERRFRLLMRT